MPDIFGRSQNDYSLARDLAEKNQWDDYQLQNRALRPHANPNHNFEALNGGVPEVYKRASQDAQALGYVTDNLLALQTMVDEILYTDYRLPSFVHINTNIAEGAASYGVPISDRRGRAARLTAPGYEAPSANVSRTRVTKDMHIYGLDAEWSLDELRGAMYTGVALDTETIEAAVTGTMETMEAVALTGGEYAERGLLNLDAAANPTGEQARLKTQGANQTFSDLTSEQVRTLIADELSSMIVDTKETFGRNVNTGMTVYLPGEQYDLLTSRYVGDNADRTIMSALMADNPWTHMTRNPIMIERVLELEGIGAGGADRMVVALKHERVAEIGVSIMPRVIKVLDQGRVICAPVEAKFSPLFVKRANTIRYTDGV